jgi:hypothetical protein
MATQPVAKLTNYEDIPCCPQLDTDPVCDVLDFRRKLIFPTNVRGPNDRPVRVEVTLHTRFTRCSGPLALGDIVYSTTLLPGEKVRLATTDRRSRFSFDSESKLSYRSEQVSEEQYRMTALRALMSDQNSTDSVSDKSSEQGKWDFHGDASGSIGFFSAGAEANANGSHSGSSTRDYLGQHRAHAEASDHQSVSATRMAHSTSIGEVSTRAHQQGESEDHFESSSREFSNPNTCHAITFLFYRINKTETIRFELLSIERRVLDEAAPLPVPANPLRPIGHVSPIHQEVPATTKTRLEIESRGLQSEAQYSRPSVSARTAVLELGTQQPLEKAVRAKALAEVDAQLVDQALIDKPGGKVSKQAQEEVGYERKTSLPTAGAIVKSCLDICDVCEPEVHRKLALELDRTELENKLLARKIELLNKAQEYRCCPADEKEDEPQ